MAMEDPRVLLHMNMSFNPFRSHPSSPPNRPLHQPQQHQQRTDDPDHDSWHTNSPHSIHHNNSRNDGAPSSPNKSSALSWFSSWTTTTSTTAKTTSLSASTSASAITAKSSAIIIQDEHHIASGSDRTMPTSSAPSSSHATLPSQTLSPAKSMTMNRGFASPESETLTQKTVRNSLPNSIPPPPLMNHVGGVSAAGWMPRIPQQNNGATPSRILSPLRRSNSRAEKSLDGNSQHVNASNIETQLDLPPYPEPKTPMAQSIESSPRNDQPLLEEFPTAPETLGKIPSNPDGKNTHKPMFKRKPVMEQEELTFPGFALYQMAKAQYSLGNYSEALDVTTECLTFQKSSLSGSGGGRSTPVTGSPKLGSASPGSVGNVPPNISDTDNLSMTAFDLRSTFYSGVGSSVRNVVSNLKDSNRGGQHQHHHHPMLSNSIAIMVSQYPTYACVAQTLLLRGHVLAACALYDHNDDSSLLFQAVQHVEMAIVIQRKLSCVSDLEATCTGEELARPLIVLGNMKTKLGHFNEADVAYMEAVSILGDVRSDAKHDLIEAKKSETDVEVADDCAQYFKKVTGEIVHALYAHGRSYHCQRMHVKAFGCYNKALNLLKKSVGDGGSLGVKRIVRCMKNRYALEKLVSAYWDDAGTI